MYKAFIKNYKEISFPKLHGDEVSKINTPLVFDCDRVMAILETRVSRLLVVLSYCFSVGLAGNIAMKRKDNNTLLQYLFSPDRVVS